MTLKNLKLALLAVMSVMWAGCDKETSLDDTYADILLYVSETTVWETIGSGGTPAVEYMQVKEKHSAEWQRLAMGSIKGFDYVHGHAYELEVRKTILANPPADASNTTYTLLEVISDVPSVTPKPDELPEEAKFKLKMVQLTPFMNLDTPLAAPFDFLTFRILDHQDEYIFPGRPEFLQYYDSIVMSSLVLPDTYCVYRKSADESGTSEEFTSQWSSHFFEKKDFPISLKGYKDNEVKYESSITQIMRERDFLGVDWTNGAVAIANPKTSLIYSILDTRYEFLLTDTQMLNSTCYVIIKVAFSSGLTDAEYLKRQEAGLRWLLEKHLGKQPSQTAADFKTLPQDADIVEIYGNNTTRAALLHSKGDDTHEEYYYVIAEPK